MQILFATSEIADFTKSGGLGEVAAGLPRALRRLGADVRILMPGYPAVLAKSPEIRLIGTLPGRSAIPPCRLGQIRTADGLIIYVLLAPSLYQRRGTAYARPGGTDFPDNDLRMGRLSLAAAEIARGRGGLDWRPDLLHVNDWPGALAPAYLRWENASLPTLLSVHNLAHQGIFSADHRHGLGIPEWAFAIDGVEFHGQISFLKAGLYYADHVCAVSPTYAREITTEAHGNGLHGLTQGLAGRGQLSGIVNGIDERLWNPETDPYLAIHFGPDSTMRKRAVADLVRTGLCLAPSDGPFFGVVSRLVHQKGLDLVAEVAPEIVRDGGQIAMLGLGEPQTELLLNRLSRRYRDHIGVLVGFNEAMAHSILAASDFLLMPSRFEPCGLTQMQAQRLGTLPIAHATGGLADTVEDGATGFLFDALSPEALLAACRRAFAVFREPDRLIAMRQAAMARHFGWERAAREYLALYSRLSGQPIPAPLPEPAPEEAREETIPVPVGAEPALQAA
ncbi:MAG TPA: glycogen synthase GlgA [Acetobacteraceae bacterium]|nr:glycogen synthase GlgA [Acetobacteraceae bacterium]